MQHRWQEHVAAIHQHAAGTKAHLDAEAAAVRADEAETDMRVALDLAFSAVDEAESQILQATLARVLADEARAKDPRAAS
jgi:hypothetical protein